MNGEDEDGRKEILGCKIGKETSAVGLYVYSNYL